MSEEVKTLVLKLRFPEFKNAGEWVLKNIDECLDYLQPTPYLVADTNYNDGYKTPVLTAGKTFILGYTNEVNGIFEDKLPVIIFDDFTTSSQFVDFPFKAKSSAMKILIAKNSANIKFMYELLQMIQFEVGAHERHWISTFAPMQVLVPKPKEQQKIADCLSSLDDLITAQNQKVESLKQHKKGLMQQLFPAEGELVPKLRFQEFENSGPWALKRVHDVLAEKSRSIDMLDHKNYRLVTVKRRYGGVVLREVLKGELIKVKSQFLLEADDFLISKRQIVHCACGLVPKELEGSIVSNEYSVLRMKEKNDVIFFNYFCQQPIVSSSFLECSSGIVIEKMLFKLNEWLKREFLFPNHLEQQKIANFLSSIDDLITTQTQKLEAYKIYKKGLMQQLFPAISDVEK